MRVALNVNVCNSLLSEIVFRFGFASACEYNILYFNSSNVSNLSNTVPNSLGISNIKSVARHVRLTK